jgi:hypothetical protein
MGLHTNLAVSLWGNSVVELKDSSGFDVQRIAGALGWRRVLFRGVGMFGVCAVFVTGVATAQLPPVLAEGRVPFPQIRLETRDDYYPVRAKAQGIHGQVLLAFSMENGTRPVRVRVLYSDSPVLTESAVRLLSDSKLTPVSTPTPAPWYRFRMGVAFGYGNCKPPVEIAAADITINVCTKAQENLLLPEDIEWWPEKR